MEGIAYKRKYYGWKNSFQGSLKIKVTYITPCKLKLPSNFLKCSYRIVLIESIIVINI